MKSKCAPFQKAPRSGFGFCPGAEDKISERGDKLLLDCFVDLGDRVQYIDFYIEQSMCEVYFEGYFETLFEVWVTGGA